MDPFHVIFLFSLSPIIIFTDYTYKYMSKTASVLYEAGTAYPSRVSGFTPNFVGVHVHSQFCWGPCSLPVLLGSVFTPSFVGFRVHSQFLLGSVLLIMLVFGVVFLRLFVFVLCLVYSMLPVSLDCPFLINPSDFSNLSLTNNRSRR
jgi:hypothetical protein